jgi:hypothetical protein
MKALLSGGGISLAVYGDESQRYKKLKRLLAEAENRYAIHWSQSDIFSPLLNIVRKPWNILN